MEVRIKKYLKQIEEERDIKILFACETGSRAWGFPSPDSDYDVRIIYMHQKEWYLSLSESRDTIERMYDDNEIDITGWDIRKSLRLLKKSNAAMLERIQSPIAYIENEKFVHEINNLGKECFSPIASMYHYLNMAKKTMDDINVDGEYKLKKMFYALRAATACRWIIDKQEIPPIVFMEMMKKLSVPQHIKGRIEELIVLKSTKNESYLHVGEKEIFQFIAEQLDKAEMEAKGLSSNRINALKMDVFFRKVLDGYFNV